MFKSLFLLAFLGVSFAAPEFLEKRAVSPDGSCGGSKGYTCGSSNCCSQYGYCGNNAAYCGKGCQPAFGRCDGTLPLSSAKTSSKTSLESSSTSFKATTSFRATSTSQVTTLSRASLTSKSSSTRTTTSSAKPSSSASTLVDCLGQKNVPIKLASSSDWSSYEKTFNTRLQNVPSVIVVPTTAQHVSDAVVCASQFGIKVQAKSGGHSYASFSTLQGGMMIDLESLQGVTVDFNGVATVGAGLRLGNLAQAIYNQANRALSHGTCPGVGIGGHFTHGGFGDSSRAWGLALDSIVGLDVVLANGTYIHTTSSAYPDIFWALRGAADSFGIIVNFYLQTKAAPATVINYSYSFNNMYSSASKAANAFQHIQTFAQDASVVDRNLGMGVYLDESGFSISGTYFGTQLAFTSNIAPALLNGLPTPASKSIQALSWLDSLNALGGEGTLTTPVHGYSEHDNFFASSVVVPQSAPLTSAALNSYFGYIVENGVDPPTPWFSIINLYGGPDSQINVRDTAFSAYKDRNSLWVAQHYAYVESGSFPQSGINFVKGLNNAMTSQMPGTDFGKYLNYVDVTLSIDEAHSVYYGSLYPRLKSIKTAVDPANVFSNPQSI